jgi:hypothetical protein
MLPSGGRGRDVPEAQDVLPTFGLAPAAWKNIEKLHPS